MKKSKKLLIAAVLAIAAACGAAACGEEPAHVHDWGEWDVTGATCTEDGVKVRSCKGCGEEESETIVSEGHAFVDGECSVCFLPEPSEGLAITEGETYCTVTGIGTCEDTEIVIPSTYNGKPVTTIAKEAFKNNKTITFAYIPDSVTSLGEMAFANCSAMEEVRLSGNVKAISRNAFLSAGLKHLVIPDGVRDIGINAFKNMQQLETLVIGDDVTYIDNSAFSFAYSLRSVVVGEKVNYIHNYGFQYCNRLVEIYNKSSMTFTAGTADNGYIAANAKNICTSESERGTFHTDADGFVTYTLGAEKILVDYQGNATDLTLPAGLTEIWRYAMSDKLTVQSVVIPEGVTKLGFYAFSECTSLTTVELPASLRYIDKSAFYPGLSVESPLTSVTFKDANGWSVSVDSTATTWTSVSSAELTDKATAANRLGSKYDSYCWRKN